MRAKNEVIVLRVSKELKKELVLEAIKDNRTLSNHVERILQARKITPDKKTRA
jgi:predicted HicB family RNase H-like nuclease